MRTGHTAGVPPSENMILRACAAACWHTLAHVPAPMCKGCPHVDSCRRARDAGTVTRVALLLLCCCGCPSRRPAEAALSPSQIYAQVAPAIAYVDSPAAHGSGVLIGGGYVITNVHVVWPFARVRVVFPD